MKEKKELLKIKSLSINSNILKNINKLDISLNEFLLILYFININNTLDIEDIKKYYNVTDEEVLNTFTSLINKGLIETVVIKRNNIMEEEISLELFYDKLVLNEEEKIETDIFSVFESEFGRTLSPIEYETINNWVENKIPEETIKKALKEAVINGVNNLRYIDKILYEWTKKGSPNDYERESKELFDYNWLDE